MDPRNLEAILKIAASKGTCHSPEAYKLPDGQRYIVVDLVSGKTSFQLAQSMIEAIGLYLVPSAREGLLEELSKLRTFDKSKDGRVTVCFPTVTWPY